ncbi:MAG: succinylglutamate desuccinylase, partial [Mesorhizobium sp.]
MAIVDVGATPHPSAGTFSPYSDGEKGAGRNLGALSATLEIGEILCEGVFLPVTIRGEMPGRAMRGG